MLGARVWLYQVVEGNVLGREYLVRTFLRLELPLFFLSSSCYIFRNRRYSSGCFLRGSLGFPSGCSHKLFHEHSQCYYLDMHLKYTAFAYHPKKNSARLYAPELFKMHFTWLTCPFATTLCAKTGHILQTPCFSQLASQNHVITFNVIFESSYKEHLGPSCSLRLVWCSPGTRLCFGSTSHLLGYASKS